MTATKKKGPTGSLQAPGATPMNIQERTHMSSSSLATPQAPPPDVVTLVAIEDDWEPLTIEGDELAAGLREHRARTGRGPSDAEIDAVAAKVDGLTIRPAAVIAYLRQKEAETAKELKGGDR